MAAWVGQPLTDTGWRLRRPGWVSSKISSTPIPPIRLRPPSLNRRLICSLTLTAHGAGSTGLYRSGRTKQACPKAVCCSPKPTWTSFVVCGPIWRACCAPADRPRDVTLLPSASVSVRVGADGAALLEPRGDGSRRVSAIVLIETFTAQRVDNWRRLKLCRNERCAVSFYDRSRNNSAVYHDSRECGNAIYLRASRARKRQGALNTNEHPNDAEKP